MKIENKTLMETLIDAGYPREEMYHHYSDLYIFLTPKNSTDCRQMVQGARPQQEIIC